MLSRIAESLFWMGRYIERAEDTARILDVHVHHRLEDRQVEEEVACASLLSVMGVPRPSGRLDGAAVIDVLALSKTETSSIVASLTAAREHARGARDSISLEMWQCVNATYNGLAAQTSRAMVGGPHAMFQYVKERAAVLWGLADSTMSRDDGWRFLVLGRSLERIDMTARLLSVQFGERSGPAEWVTTLRCCSAHEAFLRTYRRQVDAALVAEFLLLDRLFPRSAFYTLGVAESCLADLDPGTGRSGLADEARRVLGRARTDLEFLRVDELLSDLPARLKALQACCSQAAEAVALRFFRRTAPTEWNQEGAEMHV